MKIFIFSIFITIACVSTVSCNSNVYQVYYFPVDMDFYVPPTRDDLINNAKNFLISSLKIRELFKNVSKEKGEEAHDEDYTGLRILIIDSVNKTELFITSDRIVLSMEKNKRYLIDTKMITGVLNVLENYVNNMGDK